MPPSPFRLVALSLAAVGTACGGSDPMLPDRGGPAGDTIAFGSEWAGATGTGSAAVLDASGATPWDGYFTGPADGTSLLEVVPAATVEARCGGGWPTENSLEVSYQEPWANQIEAQPNVSYAPGDTIYVRAYTCNATPAGQQNANGHWMHWHISPYVLWLEDSPNTIAAGGGLTSRMYDGVGQTSGFGNYMNQPATQSTNLTTNTIYRHEFAVSMESRSRFNVNYRVFNAGGTLALSGKDYIDNFGEAAPSDSIGSNPGTISGTLVDACAFQIGNNDNRPQNPNANRYIGALACRVNGGWIGAYPAPGESS